MKTFAREYGLVTVLIVVGLVGYVLYDQNREDVLSYSLDVVGERLLALVDDPVMKEALATRFAQYKRDVLEEDVAPREVEQFAANVLNLSNSGEKLTMEEAELVLADVTYLPEPAGSLDAPAVPQVQQKEALGERLHTLLVFHREMEEAMPQDPETRREWMRHVRVVAENGLHLAVDPALSDEMREKASRQLAREVEKMERKNVLVWKQQAPPPMPPDAAQRALRIEGLTSAQKEIVLRQVKRLEALHHLEAMGYQPSADAEALAASIEAELAAAFDSVEVRLDALKIELEGARARVEGSPQ